MTRPRILAGTLAALLFAVGSAMAQQPRETTPRVDTSCAGHVPEASGTAAARRGAASAKRPSEAAAGTAARRPLVTHDSLRAAPADPTTTPGTARTP